MSGSRQSLAQNLLLASVVTLLCLGGLELGGRVLERGMADPFGEKLALWEKVWAGDFYLMRADTAGWPPSQPINPDGLQDRTRPEEKPEGVWRVMFLGDSVTAGTPFEPAKSYPALLRQRLEAEGPWVEVLNVALWGWSTRQERIAFERIGRRYHPDQVIVGLCLNDAEELQNNLSQPPPWLAGLHRRSALVRRLVRAETRQIRSIEELFDDSPRTTAAFERLFAELRSLRDEVRQTGASFSVLVFPVEFQFGERPPPPRAQERVLAFCASEGIRCLDLRPALEPLGKEAFEDLLHLDPRGRQAVADHLAAAGLIPSERRGAPHLTALAAAVEGPGRLPLLTGALAAPSEKTRAEAAWAIGRLEADRTAALGPLRRALDDPHECVRVAAARALGAIGAPARGAAPALLRRLSDPRASVRWASIDALWAMGGHTADEVPAFLEALAGGDRYVRAGVLWTLRAMGDEARAALPAVTAATRDDDPGIRAVAVRAVARIGRDDPTSVTALVAAMQEDGESDARWRAARALGLMGEKAAEAVPALIAAISSDNALVRREALTALGRIGPLAEAASAEALGRALEDPDPGTRALAATALGRQRSRRARPDLERRLADRDESVREAARAALEAIGPGDGGQP